MKSLSDLIGHKPLFLSNFSKSKMHPKISENVGFLEKLQPHQEEFQQLSELAGIHMDAKVFRILVEFLNMGADPNTVFAVLKSIRRSPHRQRSVLSQKSVA